MPKHNKSQAMKSSVSQAKPTEKLFTGQKEQRNPRTAQKLQRQMKTKTDQAAEATSEGRR